MPVVNYTQKESFVKKKMRKIQKSKHPVNNFFPGDSADFKENQMV